MKIMNTPFDKSQQANSLDKKDISKKVYNPPVLNVLDVDQTQAKPNIRAVENPGNGQGPS